MVRPEIFDRELVYTWPSPHEDEGTKTRAYDYALAKGRLVRVTCWPDCKSNNWESAVFPRGI